jgi:hypothetical protein
VSKRDGYSPEALAREREANRLRMARLRADPEYLATANARRKQRERERKASDPTIRPRLTAASKRYYESRRGDPEFWSKRKEYWRRWKAERLLDEQFEDFMRRIENR